MKKLFLTVLIMCCSTAFGQGVKISTGGAIAFNKPVIDTTVLPDASTTVMLHFENNYEDLGGSTWANGINPWSGFSTTRRFGGFCRLCRGRLGRGLLEVLRGLSGYRLALRRVVPGAAAEYHEQHHSQPQTGERPAR